MIAVPTRPIRKINHFALAILFLVRIKIIVHHHAIGVVTFHHVDNHVNRMVPGGRFSWVEPKIFAVAANQLGICFAYMIRGWRVRPRNVTSAERIKPGVQFQSSFVRLINRKRQWVVPGSRGRSHLSHQIFRPWLEFGVVQCVAARTHLQKNRIQVNLSCPVENPQQLLLLICNLEARLGRPIDIVQRRHPGAAKFTLHARRNNVCRNVRCRNRHCAYKHRQR